MGKLYLNVSGEYLKDCTESEYAELMITNPGEYHFRNDGPFGPTIQHLSDFATRAMERNIIDKEKKMPDNAKRRLTKWSEIWCIIAGIIALIGFIVWLIK